MSDHRTLLQDMKRGINCRLEAIAAIESLEAHIEALENAAIDAVQGYEAYAESGFEEVLDPPMMALAALLQETDHE